MTIKILSAEAFADFATVVDIYGQGCNRPTKKGVEGFQVDFVVEATNSSGESKKFHIVYQSLERSDNLMAYSGVEMTTASKYGADSDQSGKLNEFMDHESDFGEMKDRAEALCKNWLEH